MSFRQMKVKQNDHGRILGMILGTHYAGLLGKMLVGKELVRAGSPLRRVGQISTSFFE